LAGWQGFKLHALTRRFAMWFSSDGISSCSQTDGKRQRHAAITSLNSTAGDYSLRLQFKIRFKTKLGLKSKGQIPLHYLARDLARELVRELVCDLLWLNSIKLSRSQTWFPTWGRQVRAISTCRDRSNLVADRFGLYSITLSCLLVSELDSVMEFG